MTVSELKEYIYNCHFQVLIINNMIDILNYTDIVSFSDTKIILKHSQGIIEINGHNLIIAKLLDDELLIKGSLTNIEFR